jgi:uncharacterized SAM-dependent methyltransferase
LPLDHLFEVVHPVLNSYHSLLQHCWINYFDFLLLAWKRSIYRRLFFWQFPTASGGSLGSLILSPCAHHLATIELPVSVGCCLLLRRDINCPPHRIQNIYSRISVEQSTRK